MKKLLGLSAMLLALGLMLTGCASKDKGEAGPSIPHPRTYTFDVIDGGSSTISLVFNSYGPNYQATPFFTPLVKKDKPQAGDTVIFKMKAVSDVDLPLLLAYPCSTSPSWTPLDSQDEEARVMARDVKAGEPFECEISWVLTTKMGGDFALCMQYDNESQEVKTGGPCKLTLERICESTDTTAEVPSAPHNTNPTVALEKYAAFLEIATNHPWVNGAQDMSVIANYQATPEVTNAFGDDLPKAGDKLTVTWTAVSDVDIAQVYMRPVDCSAAAGWWKELIDIDWENQESMIIVKDVKAGVPFQASITFDLAVDPVAQVNLCVWYDVGDANPDGPAITKLAKIDVDAR